MLNVRCGTEHACTGEILSRKESRRHESCPRSHHRPRSVFFGARELQFCPCSTVSAPALLPSYLRGPAGRCCKTRVRARGRPEIQDRELLLTLGAVSVQGKDRNMCYGAWCTVTHLNLSIAGYLIEKWVGSYSWIQFPTYLQ